MPVGVIELTSRNDRLVVSGFNVSETGSLIGLTAVALSGDPQVGQLLVEAGIMRGGRGDAFKVAVLIREYVYVGRPGFWNGLLNHNPGDIIYLEIRGSGVFRVRLSNFTRLEGE